jgi:hypothetical protein
MHVGMYFALQSKYNINLSNLTCYFIHANISFDSMTMMVFSKFDTCGGVNIHIK